MHEGRFINLFFGSDASISEGPEESFEAETDGWETAVVGDGGTVSAGRKTLVDLIVGLKADGIWTKIDRLWLFAAENSQSALRDLVAASAATLVNAPVFEVDRGYTGNAGANRHVNSNFNPATAGSPKFTQDSASSLLRTALASIT